MPLSLLPLLFSSDTSQSGRHTCTHTGAEVEIKCDGTAAVLQIIEAIEDADKFWQLPTEVLRAREAVERSDEARSQKHRLHPAIGYVRQPLKERPTYAGSGAEAWHNGVFDDADPGEELGKSDDEDEVEHLEENDSDSDADDDAPLVTNASRQQPVSSRARQLVEDDEDDDKIVETSTTIESHEVDAVMGAGQDGVAEMWLGVRVKTRSTKKVTLHFLEAHEDEKGMFLLSGQVAQFDNSQIEHSFGKVQFVKTTTKTWKRGGGKNKRRKVGRGQKRTDLNTQSPIDTTVLDEMLEVWAHKHTHTQTHTQMHTHEHANHI